MGIVKSLNNRYIEQIAGQAYDIVTRMWFLSFQTRTQEELQVSLAAHLKILDMPATRNVTKSQNANREHLDQFVSHIYKHLMPKSMSVEGIGKYYR